MNQQLLAIALIALASAFQSPDKTREQTMTPERAGLLFATNCASCHVAPDPAYASDRAWIGQLRETA